MHSGHSKSAAVCPECMPSRVCWSGIFIIDPNRPLIPRWIKAFAVTNRNGRPYQGGNLLLEETNESTYFEHLANVGPHNDQCEELCRLRNCELLYPRWFIWKMTISPSVRFPGESGAGFHVHIWREKVNFSMPLLEKWAKRFTIRLAMYKPLSVVIKWVTLFHEVVATSVYNQYARGADCLHMDT